MSQKDPDLQKIKRLIEIMKDNELIEIEISHGGDKILLKRNQPQQPTIAAVPIISPNISAATNCSETTKMANVSAPQQDDGLVDIKSPLVGTFYATASPDSEPFVELNSHVTPQTVIGIVEAMKVMNEIKAETSGVIVKILVTSGQAVEYGQPLFKVKPE